MIPVSWGGRHCLPLPRTWSARQRYSDRSAGLVTKVGRGVRGIAAARGYWMLLSRPARPGEQPRFTVGRKVFVRTGSRRQSYPGRGSLGCSAADTDAADQSIRSVRAAAELGHCPVVALAGSRASADR